MLQTCWITKTPRKKALRIVCVCVCCICALWRMDFLHHFSVASTLVFPSFRLKIRTLFPYYKQILLLFFLCTPCEWSEWFCPLPCKHRCIFIYHVSDTKWTNCAHSTRWKKKTNDWMKSKTKTSVKQSTPSTPAGCRWESSFRFQNHPVSKHLAARWRWRVKSTTRTIATFK